MERMFDTAPCCFFSFNDSGELLTVNQTCCDTLGYSRQALEGSKLSSIFPVATNIFYQTHFFPLLKMQGYASEIFIFLLHKDGTQVPVLMNARRETHQGSAINQCVAILVPNRKKFEEELLNAKKIAERALSENSALKNAELKLTQQSHELETQIRLVQRQVKELKQLNKIATHDLQEPLRKISIFSKLLQKDKVVNPALNKLLTEVNTMHETLDALQQYVWLAEAPLSKSAFELKKILDQVLPALHKEFDPGLLEISCGKVPPIAADPAQFSRLLHELLKNAIQYRKAGLPARVHISGIVLKKNVFKAIANRYQYEDYVQLIVADQGIGFNPVFNEQVFELFKKLHHENRRGMGLSYCRLITQNHDGSIEAHSVPGEGTCFTVLLPC